MLPPEPLATEVRACGCATWQPRNRCDQVWVIQLKLPWLARRALTNAASLGAVVSTTWPGSVYVPLLSVTPPVQLALDSLVALGSVHAPTPLKARFRRIPVCCSQLTT